MAKKIIWMGMSAIVLILIIAVSSCDDSTGNNTVINTLVITDIDETMAAQGRQSGIQIGIFPVGTAMEQAYMRTNIIAGTDEADLSGNSAPYTVTAQLYSASSDFKNGWTGSGTYDVYILLGSSIYFKGNVSFTSDTTMVNATTFIVPGNNSNWPPDIVTILTENQWNEGNIPRPDDEQWFSFTATASIQYIHAEFGTLTDIWISLYDSNGYDMRHGGGNAEFIANFNLFLEVIPEQTYYILVRPFENKSGSYRITFKSTIIHPDSATLVEDQWLDGNISQLGGFQWFGFNAAASEYYIHFTHNTQSYISMAICDSNGDELYEMIYMNGIYVTQTLNVGQDYYIRIVSNEKNSGKCRLVISSSIIPPDSVMLIEDQWVDSNSNEFILQWFRFKATASTHCIHYTLNTPSYIVMSIYDSNGDEILYGMNEKDGYNITPILNVGQDYYVKIGSYQNNSGSYKLMLCKSFITPDINTIMLAENQWEGGIIHTTDDEQWFSFTATASNQFFHIQFGTLTGMWITLYYSSGIEIGQAFINADSVNPFSWFTTPGQTYYILVRPFNNKTGDYKITFNSSIITPDTVTLVEDQWLDGSINELGGRQWFRFNATASVHFVHFPYNSPSYISMAICDSNGNELYEGVYIEKGVFITPTLNIGQDYYIRIVSNPNNSGTFRLVICKSIFPPDKNPIMLTENQWKEGSILISNDEQWFSFMATSSPTHDINVKFGTLRDLSIVLYISRSINRQGFNAGPDSIGATMPVSTPLTPNEIYCIKVIADPDCYGTYQIGVNMSW